MIVYFWITYFRDPSDYNRSKLRAFEGPIQDQKSCYKDFYGNFHMDMYQKYIMYLVIFHPLAFGKCHLPELGSLLYFVVQIAKHEFWFKLLGNL